MENKRITSIVLDDGYYNVKADGYTLKIEASPGLFYIDRWEGHVDYSDWEKAVNVWQVTVQDESGKETYIRATNYADASGPYHWPEGLPWTPREEQRND